MVFSIHDFTDSESEMEDPRPPQPRHDPLDEAGIYTREASEASLEEHESPSRAGPSSETHPLRVTASLFLSPMTQN